MQGIERQYCEVCIRAVIDAWRALMNTTAAEALRRVEQYGKADTLGLDAVPEIHIAERIREFDEHAILITEEHDIIAKKRWPNDSDPLKLPLMFFSDPTDRSIQLEKFVRSISEKHPFATIGELMADIPAGRRWEEMFEPPAVITGASTSITCIRKGSVAFTVLLNYITGTLFLAVPFGIFRTELPSFRAGAVRDVDFSSASMAGSLVKFCSASDFCPAAEDAKRFVTFLGKSGYRENFNDSMIFVENPETYLHHTNPGGPSRVLFLSELQKGFGPVGFVLANGEKIGEWMPWLSFVKFAKNSDGERVLRAYEISIDRPWTKDGILMSTSPAYSLFSCNEDGGYLDLSRLKYFEHPGRFRCMLVVTQYDNHRMTSIMRQHGYREIGTAL